MLKIRLMRTGKKNQPSFRVVVAPAKSKRNGQYVASLGFYQPLKKVFKINLAQYEKWLKLGAQPTETVLKLIKKQREKTS